MEKAIPRAMSDAVVRGLSITIIDQNQLSWSQGFGVKNTRSKEPVRQDTMFEAASLSKPVFAYAVMKLCEKGVLNLDTPQMSCDVVQPCPNKYPESQYFVSFIHPLGHEHGFNQVKENVYQRLMGGTFSQRKLNIHDVSVHVYGDAAWAEFYWDFAAKLKKDGSAVTTHGRETQVYCKTRGQWRLVHVHYSGMPATEKGTGF